MVDQDEKLSLQNIKEGAAIEMFDLALERVFSNIRDVNTTLKKREIILKMELLPSEDRTLASISFEVGTKLANQGTQKATVDIKLDKRGRPYARERLMQRGLGLAFENVTDLETGKE